jgi:hypothetical protein
MSTGFAGGPQKYRKKYRDLYFCRTTAEAMSAREQPTFHRFLSVWHKKHFTGETVNICKEMRSAGAALDGRRGTRRWIVRARRSPPLA